jgi:hypothetical protein
VIYDYCYRAKRILSVYERRRIVWLSVQYASIRTTILMIYPSLLVLTNPYCFDTSLWVALHEVVISVSDMLCIQRCGIEIELAALM